MNLKREVKAEWEADDEDYDEERQHLDSIRLPPLLREKIEDALGAYVTLSAIKTYKGYLKSFNDDVQQMWLSRLVILLLNLISFPITNKIIALSRYYLRRKREKNILDIDILHANKGKHLIELFDAKGVKIKEVQLVYNGLGALESWNLSSLSAGQYILNIRQMHPANGKQVKNGVFKILKVN